MAIACMWVKFKGVCDVVLNHLYGQKAVRRRLAARYLRGRGIEIGALHAPLRLPWRVHAQYVDRMSVDELRRHYPELRSSRLVPVDIIDDAETLATIKDGSFDFVIANHLLEHCQDPVKAIENFLRVLRKGGILYLAVPDKRFTFDRARLVTDLEHILKDYSDGPAWSRQKHFDDWAALVDHEFKSDPSKNISVLKREDYSIHFHVWTKAELLIMLRHLKDNLGFNFTIIDEACVENECIFIIFKPSGS